MFKNTLSLSEQMLLTLKAELDGGSLHIFSGSEPANADDALDMSGDHTHLCTLTLDGDGTTGLTLDTPAGNLIAKPSAALVDFDSFEASQNALAPAFFRLCAAGDDGRRVAAGARVQGSAGGPASAADMLLGSDTLTDDSASTVTLSIFNYRIA